MILGLLYVGFAVEDVDRTRRAFSELFGLPGERMEPDPFLGTDKGARIAFPNDCWLYVMQSQQPASPVYQYVQQGGPGLERVAFLTDDIEEEFERVRRCDVPLSTDAIVDTITGRRFVVPPEYVNGVTVELVEPSDDTWDRDIPANISGVLGLQHIGVVARCLETAYQALYRGPWMIPEDYRDIGRRLAAAVAAWLLEG